MAGMKIVSRNPHIVPSARMWRLTKANAVRSLYVVVEPSQARGNSWEGLPTLEVLHSVVRAPANSADGSRSYRAGA